MESLIQVKQRIAGPTASIPLTDSPKTYSPSHRIAVSEPGSRTASPLRAEFKTTESMDTSEAQQNGNGRPTTTHSVRFDPPTPGAYNAANGQFQLQEAPKGKRKTSDYFSAQQPSGVNDIRQVSDSTPNALTRRRTPTSGTRTPTERRSVQFVRHADPDNPSDQAAPKINESDAEDGEETRGRQPSFLARLRSFATPTSAQGHTRHASSATSTLATPFMTPASELDEPRYPVSNQDGSEAEGDIEESSEGEDAGTSTARPRRKRKRRIDDNTAAAANTPRTPRFPSFLRESSFTTSPGGTSEQRPNLFQRRATMGDIPENSRAGVSEDEGRARMAKSRWRRGIEGARGLSHSHSRAQNDAETPEGKRPGTLRRFTGMGAFDGTGSPFRAMADRHNSSSVQKWRQVKAGLKMLGQRKKDERVKVDYQKSTELMAELLAGSPAALFFASMYQRDEHGRRKIPVLLEQLKITIPSSTTREDKAGDRHMIFVINLEYGNGPSRMTWTINRYLRDFANLHVKYKLQSQTEKYIQLKGEDKHRAKIPRFPKSAFPYLRGMRNLADLDDGEEDDIAAEASAHEGEASGTDRPSNKKRRQSSFVRRKSSTGNATLEEEPTGTPSGKPGSIAGGAGGQRVGLYADRQRKKLEVYLQQMIRWLIFRPDSNRLCKFLELSALAMRLSVEGGYHGKEGLLTITSSRAAAATGLVALRSLPSRLKTMPDRHKPKWFLVRHSYLVAVDSPESLLPTEVFLVDSDFATDKKNKRLRDQSAQELAKTAGASAQPKHHLIKLYNSERKLRLLAKNERQLGQFKESIESMMQNTIWAQKHRFDSFAPIRKGVFARWLVDGRDHMWQVSRAIDNARNFVYIHDWWLSPELYLRRPAAISQKWRLDRLLLRKAQEGVKIFVIVYRNIESAIPIDSEYTKAALLDLHPNICVQRSPNQFRQNQFFWAHHEKLVVIDNAMAFVGGVDLCFGRWDDPSHSLTDDKLTGFELDMNAPRNSENCQMWPGKDYSNPRVQDFYALDRPYEEMYDRTKVPRMPWHDIAMTIVGQPARDIGRHFVQRWNYILRQRTPSRPTPLLLPPPDFEKEELEKLGMNGTCQIQILRSTSSWSIGTPNKTECSIMNAYVTLIQQSQHFVYIENQFFISSCVVEGTPIVNKIGDALVERIERAYENGDNWRACIVIPLMPGFQNSVDAQDGTSIRLIMQCQYRSICRGETSIFGRLRAKGIDPQHYIDFYALRQWGKIGPRKALTTEQLYIHAKCMIVDDRSCIIGSANINERSMLGSRDSEVAAIVTDQELVPSFMGGEPFQVGVFPHTLRMRLMREHLGIDVDEYYRQDRNDVDHDSVDTEMDRIYREDFVTPPDTANSQTLTEKNLAAGINAQTSNDATDDSLRTWIDRTGTEVLGHEILGADHPPIEKAKKNFGETHDLDVAGFGVDNMARLQEAGVSDGRETFVNTHAREVLASTSVAPHEQRRPSSVKEARKSADIPDNQSSVPPWRFPRKSTQELGLTQLSQLPALPVSDDTDIGGPPLTRNYSKSSAGVINPLLNSMRRPIVGDDCMQDPLIDSFYSDIWHQVAENNTKLYRGVFRCMPDNEVTSWSEYRAYNAYYDKFMASQGIGTSKPRTPKEAPDVSGPPGSQVTDMIPGVPGIGQASEKVTAGAAKTSSRLSDLANKLRPASKSSANDVSPEMREKIQLEQGTRMSDGAATTAVPEDEIDEKAAQRLADEAAPPEDATPISGVRRSRTIQYAPGTADPNSNLDTAGKEGNVPASDGPQRIGSQKRRRRATTKSSGRPMLGLPDEVLPKDEAEELLKLTQGNLVLWPYDWLEREEKGSGWLYSIDQIAPLEIYD